MINYKNVTVERAANVYFDGRVTSRTIILETGEKKTLGIMLSGKYVFNTGAPELMEVTTGQAEVRLPGEEGFTLYSAGESFNVPGNSSFELNIPVIFDYVCSFLEE